MEGFWPWLLEGVWRWPLEREWPWLREGAWLLAVDEAWPWAVEGESLLSERLTTTGVPVLPSGPLPDEAAGGVLSSSSL